jgi:hypothetical protein
MPSNEDFSFQSIVDKEQKEKETAKDDPIKTTDDVILAFQTASVLQERIQELEKQKAQLAEHHTQMRVLNLKLMDFFRGRDLEMKGNTGWENRVTAFFYEMFLKMRPQEEHNKNYQALVEETHRWKEAERKSDERAKTAESQLGALVRVVDIPQNVKEALAQLPDLLEDESGTFRFHIKSLMTYIEKIHQQVQIVSKPTGFEVRGPHDGG